MKKMKWYIGSLLFVFLSCQNLMAQKRSSFSMYAGTGFINKLGDLHDVMIDDGYNFSAELVYSLGAEMNINLFHTPNTLFIKPMVELSREKYEYERNSGTQRQRTMYYKTGRYSQKSYSTTENKGKHDGDITESFVILLPVTFGYRWCLGEKRPFNVSIGISQFIGTSIYSTVTEESGTYTKYDPYYDPETGNRKWYHESDYNTNTTEPGLKVYGGFGSQFDFGFRRISLRYSIRYIASDAHSLYNLLFVGYTF